MENPTNVQNSLEYLQTLRDAGVDKTDILGRLTEQEMLLLSKLLLTPVDKSFVLWQNIDVSRFYPNSAPETDALPVAKLSFDLAALVDGYKGEVIVSSRDESISDIRQQAMFAHHYNHADYYSITNWPKNQYSDDLKKGLGPCSGFLDKISDTILDEYYFATKQVEEAILLVILCTTIAIDICFKPVKG